MTCFLTRYTDTPCRYRFDGNPDPCHMIDQQRLKRAFKSRGLKPHEIAALVWDERIVFPGCRRHHDALDGRCSEKEEILLDEADYPASVREYAAENHFHFSSPRRGWVELGAGTMRRAA